MSKYAEFQCESNLAVGFSVHEWLILAMVGGWVGVWLWWRFFSRLKLLRAGELKGLLASEFLIVYGLCRILGEQFRAPDASLIELMSVELSRGTFYSLLMLGLGIALRISVKRQKAT